MLRRVHVVARRRRRRSATHQRLEISVFARVAERVHLPADAWHAALAEVVAQETQSDGVRVDDGRVVRGGLVRTNPRADCELQAPCGSSNCKCILVVVMAICLLQRFCGDLSGE